MKCVAVCLCFRSLVCSIKSFWPFRGSSRSRGPWIQSVDAISSSFLFCLYVFCSFVLSFVLLPLQDSVEYPLTQSGPYGRWFHTEFCDFLSVLVAQCQHSVIFDSYLMNTLISLLTELSNSYVRAFRHTCTLAGEDNNAHINKHISKHTIAIICVYFSSTHPWLGVKLLSALVGVALSLSVSIENSQKLCEVQKAKTMRQKSTTQLERIQKKITEVRPVSF